MTKLVFFAAFLLAFSAIAFAHDTGVQHEEPAVPSPAPSGKSSSNASESLDSAADCGKQFECRLADKQERFFWFNCYSDAGDCRCYKGEIMQCNPSKSSFSMDEWCAYQFECVKNEDSNFQFGCYFDKAANGCRCFTGEASQCRVEMSQFDKADVAAASGPSNNAVISGSVVSNASNVSSIHLDSKPVLSGLNIYVIAGAVVGFLALALIMLFFFRETPQGDLNKARHYHMKAEQMHDEGEEEEARKYYTLAEDCRARARKIEG